MSEKMKKLFLCTGNSCHSQMVERWTCQIKGDVIEAYSDGIIEQVKECNDDIEKR